MENRVAFTISGLERDPGDPSYREHTKLVHQAAAIFKEFFYVSKITMETTTLGTNPSFKRFDPEDRSKSHHTCWVENPE